MKMYKICIIISLFGAQCMIAQEASNQNLVRAVATERVQIKTDSIANNENATRSLIMMNRQATESSSVEVEDDDNNKLHLRRAISNDRALPSEIRLKRFDSDSL